MALTSLRCPSCGAEVVFSGNVIGHCPYCDSQLHFNELADRVELERLRNENNVYERLEAGEDRYRRSLKTWKISAACIAAGMAGMIIAGFVMTLMSNRYIGVLLVMAALGLILFAPAVLGAVYPYYNDRTGSTSGGAVKRTAKIFSLYGIAIVIGVLSIIAGAVVAQALGYVPKSRRESNVSAVRYSDDCDIFVREWAESMCSDDDEDIERYFSCMCPTEVWERDKDSKDTYILIERHRALLKQAIDCYKLKVTNVIKLDPLTDDELSGAEGYFREKYNCDVIAMQGYEYNFTVNAAVKNGVDVGYDNSEGDNESFVCVIKLKGDGWKIINGDRSSLKYYTAE